MLYKACTTMKNVKNTKKMKKLLMTALCLVPVLAFGAAFQNDNLSPTLEGQAMAGSASDFGDLSAIFYNPALMSTISGYQIYAAGAYSFAGINMSNASASHGFPPVTQPIVLRPVTGSTSQNNVVGSNLQPSVYFVMPLYERLTYGMAFTSPWDINTNYNSGSVLRDMTQQTNLQSYNISALFSYQWDNQWSFGAGLQAQNLYAAFSNFDPQSTGGAWTQPTQASNYSGSSWGFGYVLGALYSPDGDTHIGVSYRSQINYNLTGSGTQYLSSAPLQPLEHCTIPLVAASNCISSVGIAMNTPAVFNLSLSRTLAPQWLLNLTFSTTFWSDVSSIDLSLPSAYINQIQMNTNFQNSEDYLVGVDYFLNQRWTLRAGTGFETSPFTNSMQYLGIPLSNNVPLSAGLSYHLNNRLNIDLAYIHRFYLATSLSNTQYSGSMGNITPVEGNSAVADYAGGIDTVGLGISYKF